MAAPRRSVQRMSGSYWPGFVDAMTALLLVLMFVLTIFMVVQFVLRETISGQETELDALTAEVLALAEALGLEQQRSFQLETQVTSLGGLLETARDRAEQQSVLIANLTAQTAVQSDELAAQSARITSFEAQVATLLAERNEARALGETLAASIEDLEAANARLITDQGSAATGAGFGPRRDRRPGRNRATCRRPARGGGCPGGRPAGARGSDRDLAC